MFHIYVKVQLPDQLNSFVWNGFFFMSVSFRGCVDTWVLSRNIIPCVCFFFVLQGYQDFLIIKIVYLSNHNWIKRPTFLTYKITFYQKQFNIIVNIPVMQSQTTIPKILRMIHELCTGLQTMHTFKKYFTIQCYNWTTNTLAMHSFSVSLVKF